MNYSTAAMALPLLRQTDSNCIIFRLGCFLSVNRAFPKSGKGGNKFLDAIALINSCLIVASHQWNSSLAVEFLPREGIEQSLFL